MSQNRKKTSDQKKRARSSSPEEECAICFEPVRETAGTDSCSHAFCFPCLSVWASKKQECPLCKRKFDNIVFPVQQDNRFENHHIPTCTGLTRPCTTAQKNSLVFVPLNPRSRFRNIEYTPNQSVHHTTINIPRSDRRPVQSPYYLRPRLRPQNSCCSYHRGQTVSYSSTHRSAISSSPAAASSSASVFTSSLAAASSSTSLFSPSPAAAAASASNSNSINVVPNQSVHRIMKNIPRSGQRPVIRPYNLRERLHPRNSRYTQVRGQTVSQRSVGTNTMPTHRAVISSSPAASTSPAASSSPAAAASSSPAAAAAASPAASSSSPAAASTSPASSSSSPAASSSSPAASSSSPAASSSSPAASSSSPAAASTSPASSSSSPDASSSVTNSNSINVGPSTSGLINNTYSNVSEFEEDDDFQIIKIIESGQYSTDEEESSDETSSDEEESADEVCDEEESADEIYDEDESADDSYYEEASADESYYDASADESFYEASADESYYEEESADESADEMQALFNEED
ncbi:hypothetical protein CDAR_29541 [Caerostris darwini]|uniref:RING-type E3 ubiquitin transferase n=1 Tax=Caerostris darwini TaxID=1538125 RepID=A0AAV4VCF6_9ARAC|nr:hypothetical protein CDAR_29541 [Caerostris darwini]